jgi:hypothetical protein
MGKESRNMAGREKETRESEVRLTEELKEHRCKNCKMDCWGKEWDGEVKKWFCTADGFYIDDGEKVQFD